MTQPFQWIADDYICLDNSVLSTIKACPTMARRKFVDKRIRSGSGTKGANPGKAFHKWAESIYQDSSGYEVTSQMAESAKVALAQQYDGLELSEGDQYLNLGRMTQVTDTYLNGCKVEFSGGGKYEFDGYGRGDVFEALGVEVPFAVDLGMVRDRRLIYVGRSDIVARMRQGGEDIVVDHKTMRQWRPGSIVGWRMAPGPKGYCVCVPLWVHQGIDHLPEAIRERMLPFEGVRQELKAKGIGDRWLRGFLLNAVVIRTAENLSRCKSAPTEFHREIFYYNTEVLEEWKKDTLVWADSWVRQCDAGEWKMNLDTCGEHYGYPCQYHGVCELPPNQRQIALDGDEFCPNEWHPLSEDLTTRTPFNKENNENSKPVPA